MEDTNKSVPTLSDVARGLQALSSLGKKDLPPKLAYRIAKMTRRVEVVIKDFNDVKDNALKARGKRNETSGNFELSPELIGIDAYQSFVDEFNALLAEPCDIAIDPIPFSMFEYDGSTVQPSDIVALWWMITE